MLDWANKDFYKVLGVAKDADAGDIKKAYRKLARANHPDSNPGDKAAEERFKEVAEAYDVVGDTAKRKQYDEHALDVRRGRRSLRWRVPRRLRWRRPPAGASTSTSPTCSAASSAAAVEAAVRGRGAPRPAKGGDLETDTTLDFADAIEGTTSASG